MTTAILAAPPKVQIVAENEVKPGRILELKPTGVFEQSRWRLMYGVDAEGKIIKPGMADLVSACEGKVAHFASPTPGEYYIWFTAWNKEGFDEVLVKVVVAGQKIEPKPEPEPDPKPDPKPEPPPTPKAESLWLIIVREKTEFSGPNAAAAAIMTDIKFWKQVEDKGHTWRDYDYNQEIVKDNKYDKMIKENNLTGPSLIIFDKKTNKSIKTIPMPSSTKDIEKIITEITTK